MRFENFGLSIKVLMMSGIDGLLHQWSSQSKGKLPCNGLYLIEYICHKSFGLFVRRKRLYNVYSVEISLIGFNSPLLKKRFEIAITMLARQVSTGFVLNFPSFVIIQSYIIGSIISYDINGMNRGEGTPNPSAPCRQQKSTKTWLNYK